MDLLQQLRISHRRCGHHIQVALILAVLPLFLAGMIIFAYRGRGGPGLWMVAGLSLSQAMMLWAAHRMHFITLRRSAFVTRLVAHSDDWFPYVVIIIQGGVAAAFALLGWFTLVDLGYDATPFQFALMLALLFLWPLRRCLRFGLYGGGTRGAEALSLSLFFLEGIARTLFIAATLSNALVSPEQRQSTNFPMISVLIWVPAVLAVLVQIVLFLDRVLRRSGTAREIERRDRID